MTNLRIFSFGGGVQSHAVLVMQAQGLLRQPYDHFVFANVGEDSENPATLAYIRDHTLPYCAEHGISFVEVQKRRRDGTLDTLWQRLHREQRSIVIPARMSGNGAPGNRNCTQDHKITVIDQWLRHQKVNLVEIGLGISIDEFYRARTTEWEDHHGKKALGFWRKREYPLIAVRLDRSRCMALVTAAGLPEPPKSSCYFCPFRSRSEWIEMKRKEPELFERAAEVEDAINAKSTSLKRDGLFLHSSLKPLRDAVPDQLSLFDIVDEPDMTCDTGHCMV